MFDSEMITFDPQTILRDSETSMRASETGLSDSDLGEHGSDLSTTQTLSLYLGEHDSDQTLSLYLREHGKATWESMARVMLYNILLLIECNTWERMARPPGRAWRGMREGGR